MPGLPSQVTGIWGDWHQVCGPNGFPSIYIIVVTYAHYACVADCADAMADAWEDTAGCAQPICLHKVIEFRCVGIARDRAHMNVDCVQSMHMSVDIVSVHHSVTTRSW